MALTFDDVTILSFDLSGFQGEAWHIAARGEHYVVSAANTSDHGPETMVFAGNPDGTVRSWEDLVRVSGLSHKSAIEELLETLEA